ncbi:MAG: antirestriction protein ArdA [Planctomycetota bacterium]
MAGSDDSTVDPKAWIGCIHCYVGGRLHGRWFDVGSDPDDLHHEVMRYFAEGCETCGEYEPECPECRAFAAPFPCGGEELAVHDHEGLGDVGEAYDLPRLCAIAALVEEFEDRPVIEYLARVDGDLERAHEGLREDYAGRWDSLAEWAECWAEDAGLGLEQLWPYVDWERVARDWVLNGDVEAVDVGGAVHVFQR